MPVNARQILTDNIFRAMDRTALMMEKRAIELAPAAIGTLKRSISSKTTNTNNTITATVICASSYGKYIEEGTGPAVGHQRYFPPPGVLTNWLMRKLGKSEDEARKVEYVIRRGIYQHGTEPQPFLKPAKEQAVRQLRGILAQAITRSVKEIMSELH